MDRAIVIGGGLAGLSCTMKLAELGVEVDLICLNNARRSHSVCAQGGINAALNMKDEGDSPLIHAYETIKGGDFLGDQPPIIEMCLTAPKIIHLFDQMGCPFNRTEEGTLDARQFGGTLFSRTVFCGSSTGQQLIYTLDEQVRKQESAGRVHRYEHHEFLRLVQDDNRETVGIVMSDLFTGKIQTLAAPCVVNATGGLGVLFQKSTNSTVCTGAANGRLYMQGMKYANGEFIQIHPTAIPGQDKLRLISESVRGEGGRIFVYGDSSKTITTPDGKSISCGTTGEPWYFLEELYPAYGNLVPRDIGAREIMRVCEMGLGIDGGMQVYLDVTHLPDYKLERLESVLEIYKTFTGEDPQKTPMRIFPAVHYSMGGAWVDWPASEDPDRQKRFRQMTNIPGCFAIGEADFQYHGANRLGANALLACIFSGLVAAPEVFRYLKSHKPKEDPRLFQEALSFEEQKRSDLLSRSGSENIHRLHEELADALVHHVTVNRSNVDLEKTLHTIYKIRERYKHISLSDKQIAMNQTLQFARQFEAMIEVALLITKGALKRNESRGAHAKAEFPDRDDKNFLKTTIATYRPEGPEIEYKDVDCRYLPLQKREYTVAEQAEPQFEELPETFDLPL